MPNPLSLAKRRVHWRHFSALLLAGVPTRDLVRDQDFTFGVVMLQGRELVFTDDDRLRSYLFGPGLFKFPIKTEDVE